jgi:N-acetylglucosamine-6-phosphate deacetylase
MSPLSLPETGAAYTLRNARAVLEDRILEDAALVVRDGRIRAMGPAPTVASEGEVFDLGGRLLLPGLVDTHIHGAGGRDFMEGTAEAFDVICRNHAVGGTTSLLATTVTDTLPHITEVLRFIDHSQQRQNPPGARILGAHVEGPFLSPERPGVHAIDKMLHPTPEAVTALAEAGGPVRIMTFAPELPGALRLLEELGARGILGSGGHSDAWDGEARAAFNAGLRRVTHTFNCMSMARKRGALREAGLLEFALSEPEITCELIADGIHVSPTLMRMLYRAKGAAGICLITDASAGCGMPEGQPFVIAGRACVVSAGKAVTVEGHTLAGGVLTMITAVRNMISMVGVPLVEAVRMASFNPAQALGLENEIGTLKSGARADFLVLQPNLDLMATYIGGTRAHPASTALARE